MTTAPRIAASLAPLALLLACGPDSADQRVLGIQGIQAHSFKNSEWSTPENLGDVVNFEFFDGAPTLSQDGLSLYFTSSRPGGLGGNDFWVSQRACGDCAWGAPVHLGPVINSSAVENKAALSPDGHLLFFASNRPGGQGDQDIWVSRRANPKDDFSWEPPVNLGSDVNTPTAEMAPFYLQSAEDGAGNLYFARGLVAARAQDIYVAPVTRDGETRGPAVIVSELNDPTTNDAGPTVRADGREIIFSSSRLGTLGVNDLYTSTRRSIHDPWSPPVTLGTPMNSPGVDQQPSLSHDGRTLLWASTRPGSTLRPDGLPSLDIWMATRTPSGKEEP